MVESECILGNIQDSAGSLPTPYQQCLRNASVKTGSHTAAYGVFYREKITKERELRVLQGENSRKGPINVDLPCPPKNGQSFLGDPSFACSSLSSSRTGPDGKQCSLFMNKRNKWWPANLSYRNRIVYIWSVISKSLFLNWFSVQMRKCEEKHPWPVKCRCLYIVYVFWCGFWCSGSQSISSDYSSLLDQEHDQLYTVCSMRIIVDQWVLKDQNADKNVMSLIVHNHINSLNVIYEKNVRYKGRQLRSYLDVFFLGWPPRKKIIDTMTNDMRKQVYNQGWRSSVSRCGMVS